MPEGFVPSGGIVAAGVVRDETGTPRGQAIKVEAQGDLAGLETSREGLARLQALLLQAAAHVGAAMVKAPSIEEGASRVVLAHSMPRVQ